MRNVVKKKNWPLAAAYGINPKETIPLVTHLDSCAEVNLGWIQLHFGWDDKWCEVVFAITEKDTFLLSAASKLSPVYVGSAKTCDWVYAIDFLPDDFFDEVKMPTVLQYAGFHVEHGIDREHREFVYLAMPNGELHLLFRNPASPSTNAWSPRRSIVFDNAMVIGSMAGASQMELTKVDYTTLDQELEDLLNGTGPIRSNFGGDKFWRRP